MFRHSVNELLGCCVCLHGTGNVHIWIRMSLKMNKPYLFGVQGQSSPVRSTQLTVVGVSLLHPIAPVCPQIILLLSESDEHRDQYQVYLQAGFYTWAVSKFSCSRGFIINRHLSITCAKLLYPNMHHMLKVFCICTFLYIISPRCVSEFIVLLEKGSSAPFDGRSLQTGL